MKKTLLAGLLFFSFQTHSQTLLAPVTLNMGGGSSTVTPNLIVDWSIGESTIIETFYGENSFANAIVGIHWNVTSGVLQPYDKHHYIFNFLIPTWNNKEILFYPIPTPGIVSIDFKSTSRGKISIQLYGPNGNLIGVKEFMQVKGSSTQKWDLSNCANGIYYFKILLISDEGLIIKQGTFNVEKNK